MDLVDNEGSDKFLLPCSLNFTLHANVISTYASAFSQFSRSIHSLSQSLQVNSMRCPAADRNSNGDLTPNASWSFSLVRLCSISV